MPFLPLPTLLTFTPKDPTDVDQFGVDFSAVLAECDDTIASLTISVLPQDTNLGIYGITNNMTQIFWYASGGVAGINYQVEIDITTNLSPTPRNITRSFMMPVLNR